MTESGIDVRSLHDEGLHCSVCNQSADIGIVLWAGVQYGNGSAFALCRKHASELIEKIQKEVE